MASLVFGWLAPVGDYRIALLATSLLALGAGLGATALTGGSALARAPKLGTQSPYFHRLMLGGAEVTVVSDGPLPLGPPKGTFTGATDDEINERYFTYLEEVIQYENPKDIAAMIVETVTGTNGLTASGAAKSMSATQSGSTSAG